MRGAAWTSDGEGKAVLSRARQGKDEQRKVRGIMGTVEIHGTIERTEQLEQAILKIALILREREKNEQ